MQTLMRMAVIVAICASVSAQEKRVEMGWTGENGFSSRQLPSVDRSLPSYTSGKRQEFLRAATDDCANADTCKELKVQFSQRALGSPFGKSILQIDYTFAGDPGPNQNSGSYWKSIVIETGPGMYRELFLLKNEGGFWLSPPTAASIVESGTTKLLVTNDLTTSRDMFCTGEFWVLKQSGAAVADFSEIEKAIAKAVPSGTQNVTPMCAAVDLRKLEVRGDVQKVPPKCRTCDVEGQVVVKFTFEGQRAVPLSATFKPER